MEPRSHALAFYDSRTSAMRPGYAVPTAIVCGGIIIAIAVYASIPQTPPELRGNANISYLRPVSATDHLFGNPSAPIVIVTYSDFECSFCKGFHETMHHLIAIEGAKGTIAWVFRQFPLTEIHENALKHARASECIATVAGNTAFWAFADALFKSQPVNPSQYGSLATTAGVKGNAFATCMASDMSAIDARIQADRENALTIGATGTPYSVILLKDRAPIILDGAYSYDAIKEVLAEVLQNVK